MHKISNEEFFEGIKNDLKQRENKKDENFDDFSILEENLDEITQAFFADKDANDSLENSNNIYVECQITKEEAVNGCNKTIQVKRKQDNNTEKVKTRVKIPPNIQNGNKIILYNEGNKDKSNIGNLVVSIKVK